MRLAPRVGLRLPPSLVSLSVCFHAAVGLLAACQGHTGAAEAPCEEMASCGGQGGEGPSEPTAGRGGAGGGEPAGGGVGGGRSGGTGGIAGGTGIATVVLPVEVLGAPGYTQTIALPLPEGRAARLALRTHRAAFEDASVQPQRGPKASVSLNGGPFVGLVNANVTCAAHEAAYGCLSGAYHTVRLRLDIDALGAPGPRAGDNELRFRFEATDGQTSGWRVLEVNFLDEANQPLVPASVFAHDDPAAWRPPHDTPESIAEGKALFEARVLEESPLTPNNKLLASCADCHAQDGRDLAYFNFSNWSIEARSQFHGLSRREGQLIASYVRDRGRELARASGVSPTRWGRPWNPPYQPGPGLDDEPVFVWAAGAGVDAVAEEDVSTLGNLAEGEPTPARLAAALSPGGDVNHRTLPVALQLPDWNDWLPEVHPLDIWGARFERPGYEIGTAAPFAAYEDARAKLAAGDLRGGLTKLDFFAGRVHSHAGGRLIDLVDFEETYEGALSMAVSGMNLLVYEGPSVRSVDREVANRSLRHWSSVKQWELVHGFGLEGRAQELRGPTAEPRSWLTQARNVFELAPHRAAHDNTHFSYQSELVGKYFSTAWYELQVVLNAGRGFAEPTLSPVDWNYQANHIADLHSYGGPAHPVRLAGTIAEMLQRFQHQTPSSATWGFRQMHPVRWASGTGQGKVFEALPVEERRSVLTALLRATMDLFERFDASTWQRAPTGSMTATEDANLEPASYVPKLVTNMSLAAAHHEQRYADCWFTMIPRFRQAGADEAQLTRLIDWGKTMWPGGDWDSLR